jgi:hypothetical protein
MAPHRREYTLFSFHGETFAGVWWYIFHMAKSKSGKKIRSKSKTSNKTKKKTARKAKAKVTSQPKASKRNVSGNKVRGAAKKKRSSKPAATEIHSLEPSTLSGRTFPTGKRSARGGIATRSAGQSGDVQGLSRKALVDSESVEELVEEGQALEAAAISGIEDAPDPDEAEVTTREVPEDDVPEEYTDED